MAMNTFVELDLPETADLASYTGILYDLETVDQFAAKLLEARDDASWDSVTTDALNTAMLVRYARPFSRSNARRALGAEAVALFDKRLAAVHLYILALRNKYAAHSDNAYEDNRPVARYWVERVQEEGIEQIQCQQIRTLGLGPPVLEAVRELIALLKSHVQGKIDVERSRVLEIVRAKPLSEILSRSTGASDPHPDPFQTRRPY